MLLCLCVPGIHSENSTFSSLPFFPLQKRATDECHFLERLESNNYNTYRSRKYPNMYVALKRTGQYKCGSKTGPGQKAILFLPMSAKCWAQRSALGEEDQDVTAMKTKWFANRCPLKITVMLLRLSHPDILFCSHLVQLLHPPAAPRLQYELGPACTPPCCYRSTADCIQSAPLTSQREEGFGFFFHCAETNAHCGSATEIIQKCRANQRGRKGSKEETATLIMVVVLSSVELKSN